MFDQNDLTENDAVDEIFREVLEPLHVQHQVIHLSIHV